MTAKRQRKQDDPFDASDAMIVSLASLGALMAFLILMALAPKLPSKSFRWNPLRLLGNRKSPEQP